MTAPSSSHSERAITLDVITVVSFSDGKNEIDRAYRGMRFEAGQTINVIGEPSTMPVRPGDYVLNLKEPIAAQLAVSDNEHSSMPVYQYFTARRLSPSPE